MPGPAMNIPKSVARGGGCLVSNKELILLKAHLTKSAFGFINIDTTPIKKKNLYLPAD